MIRPGRVAALLLGSGMCALIYQIAWLRSLRLIFGASTASNAAVLAIFMGGLGLGGFVLGARADRSRNPLRMYALLELGVVVCAALSPWLISAARRLYLSAGGTLALGAFGGTVLKLVLSTLVLGPATFLMGGTLPAVTRAVQREEDASRTSMALLYGSNTIGAVAGAMLGAFVLLEALGIRATLAAAAMINACVAGVALLMARGRDTTPEGASAVSGQRSAISRPAGSVRRPRAS